MYFQNRHIRRTQEMLEHLIIQTLWRRIRKSLKEIWISDGEALHTTFRMVKTFEKRCRWVLEKTHSTYIVYRVFGKTLEERFHGGKQNNKNYFITIFLTKWI